MGPDRQSVAAQVTEMRRIGSDIQLVEVKESVGKLPASMGETISAFSNGSGGLVILGLSEKNGFRFAEGFDARKAADAFAEICSNKMEPPVRPETDIIQFEGPPGQALLHQGAGHVQGLLHPGFGWRSPLESL